MTDITTTSTATDAANTTNNHVEATDTTLDAVVSEIANTTVSDSTSTDQEFVQKTIIPFLMSNKTYDILKWIVQYIIPGLGVLYVLIAAAAGLPYTEAVTGIVFAVDWFLGFVLGISTKQYNKHIVNK